MNQMQRQDTTHTTISEKKKANKITRAIVAILKLFRPCCRKKK